MIAGIIDIRCEGTTSLESLEFIGPTIGGGDVMVTVSGAGEKCMQNSILDFTNSYDITVTVSGTKSLRGIDLYATNANSLFIYGTGSGDIGRTSDGNISRIYCPDRLYYSESTPNATCRFKVDKYRNVWNMWFYARLGLFL